jgi:hypothetical protein
MDVHCGETWGKHLKDGHTALYLVLKVSREGRLTLQNLANPASIFETWAENFAHAGYFLVSQTPYVNLKSRNSRRVPAPKRCPRTVDLFEGRADCEPPTLSA